MVRALVDAGADIEAKAKANGDLTPLHYAAGNNDNPAMVRALVDAGADIEARTINRGLTPTALCGGIQR